MKSIEEIKKGLECCRVGDCDCENCPYKHKKSCMHYLKQDALTLIQQLEEKAALYDEAVADALQLERERDAAVEFLVQFGTDIPCDELNHSEFCEQCTFSRPEKECWLRYFKEYGVRERM